MAHADQGRGGNTLQRRDAWAIAFRDARYGRGGYLLHGRFAAGSPKLRESLALPVLHVRTAVIGGPTNRPLHDTIWIHRRSVD